MIGQIGILAHIREFRDLKKLGKEIFHHKNLIRLKTSEHYTLPERNAYNGVNEIDIGEARYFLVDVFSDRW